MKPIAVLYYFLLIHLFKVDSKKVLFESSVGKAYNGNPRYIYEEMVIQGLDKKYKCIWVLNNNNTVLPGNCERVKRYNWKYFYYIATSGYWIFDCRQPSYIKKRHGTVYVQTWHGTPLKKLALDMTDIHMFGETNLSEYQKRFKKESGKWDILISQNQYSTQIFRKAFAYNGKIIESGYPRNDILFKQNNPSNVEKIKRRLGLPLNKKVVLYAPTWRDDQYDQFGEYIFKNPLDFEYLRDSLEDEYIFILKFHYIISKSAITTDGFIFNMSQYPDIQELYLVSDILVTDYSSVMFDYSNLKRPIILYAYDYQEYKDSTRGFYFDIEGEIPGPIVKDVVLLVDEIRHAYNHLNGEYSKKYDEFNSKFNSLENGNSSKILIDELGLGVGAN